jgi:hypothetical protein
MPAFLREQEKMPVLNGRPTGNFGPPIGLFHPVFNAFQTALKMPGDIPVDPEAYKLVKGLFNAAGELYEFERQRVSAIDQFLPDLLGSSILTASGVGVESDGVVMEFIGTSQALVVFREVKNEIGTAHSDPYNQASCAYRKYWVQSLSKLVQFVPMASG